MKGLLKINLRAYQAVQYKKWKTEQKLPVYFWQKFKLISPESTVGELLYKIDQVLLSIYKGKRDAGKSFNDSRFTLIPEALKRGMVSCGIMTTIFATILRNFGIPTKLVHGKIKGSSINHRHAWLKIYHPQTKKWISIDPTQNHRAFRLQPNARQRKIFVHWDSTLKNAYVEGRL